MEIANFWTTISNYKWIIFWLVFIWCFRTQLASILDSLGELLKKMKSTTFEFLGLKLGTEASLSLGSEDIHNEKFNLFLKASQSPNITNEEKTISEQLIQAKFSNAQAIAILISQLANRNILTKLFLLDRWIYEEQIELLLYLNSNSKTCTASDLEKFYTAWQAKDIARKNALSEIGEIPANYKTITPEEFLAYLVVHNLIIQTIHGYSISSLGKDYLSFAVKAGRQLPTSIQ